MGGRPTDRALRFFTGFERLIRFRERMGITLKEMAELSADLAAGYPDAYAEVTEEELKAVEDDSRHGMSMASVMYIMILRSSITVSDPVHADENDIDYIKGRWKRDTAIAAKEHKRLLELSDDAQVTGMNINYEHDGLKRQIYIRINNHDKAFEDVRNILLEHLEAAASNADRWISARERQFRMMMRK